MLPNKIILYIQHFVEWQFAAEVRDRSETFSVHEPAFDDLNKWHAPTNLANSFVTTTDLRWGIGVAKTRKSADTKRSIVVDCVCSIREVKPITQK